VEALFLKLVSILVEPVQLVLLLACGYLIFEKKKIIAINDKMIDAQIQQGLTMTKMSIMIESMFRSSKGGGDR
jgi:hypothetical protein